VLKCFYPRDHVYKVRIRKLKKAGWDENDCPICYSELEFDDGAPGEDRVGLNTNDSLNTSLASTVLETTESLGRAKKMKHCFETPCKHYFHQKCLIKWMDVKMECPTCRATLPPY
jgi:hypothetical protein